MLKIAIHILILYSVEDVLSLLKIVSFAKFCSALYSSHFNGQIGGVIYRKANQSSVWTFKFRTASSEFLVFLAKLLNSPTCSFQDFVSIRNVLHYDRNENGKSSKIRGITAQKKVVTGTHFIK